MELCGGPEVVGVASCDDAGAARATATGCEEGLGVTTAAAGQRINIRRAGGWIAITSVVVPSDIIGNKDDNIWFGCCRVSLVLKESEDAEAEQNPKDKGF